jgi:putative FmdB family regulatory protein
MSEKIYGHASLWVICNIAVTKRQFLRYVASHDYFAMIVRRQELIHKYLTRDTQVPTYDYACQSCDHRFELVQSFSDESITICPVCDNETIKKVFGVPSISFKGSGFYKTDSRSSSSASSTSGSSSSSSSSSSSNSSSSDTTTSTKGESSGSSSSTDSSGSNSKTAATSD